MKALFFWCAMAGAAGAEPFETDYAALFAAHADRVVMASPGERRLELPGPVVFHERVIQGSGQGSGQGASQGQVSYRDFDHSGSGVPGCTFRLLLDMAALSQVCQIGTQDARAALERHVEAAARYVGANVFPPMPPEDIRPSLVEALRDRIAVLHGEGAGACDESPAAFQVLEQVLGALATDAGQADMDRIFSQPRVVTRQPCRVRD